MMNTGNTHIVKTWIGKAIAKDEDAEVRPVLQCASIRSILSSDHIVAADGYRLHASRRIPARFRQSFKESPLIDICDLNMVWPGLKVPRYPEVEVIAKSALPYVSESFGRAFVDPQRLMKVVKWLLILNPGSKAVRLNFSGYQRDCEQYVNMEIQNAYGVFQYEYDCTMDADVRGQDFSITVNPRYLLDALWIHYYEDEVMIRLGEKHVIYIGDENANQFALVMSMTPGEYNE